MRTATLAELVENCPANYGGDPGSRDVDAPVAKVSNVAGSGEFHREFETRSFTTGELEKLAAKAGDLFVVKSSGSKKNILSGKTAIVSADSPAPLVASNFLLLLRPNIELVEPRYLWRVLNSSRSKAFVKTVVGTFTYPNLKWTTYRQHPIPLPPLAEQKRIAGILDAADALRAKRRESLAQLDTLLQSTFLDMFGDPVTNPMGWESKRLGDVLSLITYGLTVRPAYQATGVPLVSASQIKTGNVDLDTAHRISPDDFDGLRDKCKPQYGDVLFSKTGTIGHSAILQERESIALAQNVARLVFKDDRIDNLWALYYLRTDYIQRLSQRRAKGNAQKDLQLGEMEAFPTYVPPLDLQRRFATIVESVEQQKASQRAHLEELDTLFASLQQRAFKGELTGTADATATPQEVAG